MATSSSSPLHHARLVHSVTWLGQHVPTCVLVRLGNEIQQVEDEDEHSIVHQDDTGDDHLSDLSDEFENEFLSQSERVRLQSLKEEEQDDSDHDDDVILNDSKTSRHSSVYKAIMTEKQQPLEDSGGTWSSLEKDIPMKRRQLVDQVIASSKQQQQESVTSSPKRLSTKLEHNKLPYACKHECALLYVDISGFTKLSKLLDPESLSEAINSYFHLIVDDVTAMGGDILKFAGDALFAEWRAVSSAADEKEDLQQPDDGIPHSADPIVRMTLEDCVVAAATCGALIVSKYSNFPVSTESSLSNRNAATLNVHCGLGAGKVVGVHVGDHEHRREYLVLGEPIKQSTEAANKAALGEFVASPQALAVMSKKCTLDPQISVNTKEAVMIAKKSCALFTVNQYFQQRRCSVNYIWEDWDSATLQRYRKLISLYVHPVVTNNDQDAFKTHHQHQRRRRNSMQQRSIQDEAELRCVYVMFIQMHRLKVNVTGNIKEDQKLFRLLNDIMELTTRELNRFCGHLRQFIVDDKGLVLIATFGLRGSTFPNMVTERALPATTTIHNALQSELGVHNRIGATLGDAYCGLIGGEKRHEFAILGPSVNLAARLMTNKSNPGILVDDAIRMKAGKSFGFNALDPVIAKGFAAPVPIFVPLSSLERGWGKIKTSFVGRKAEIKKLAGIAREMSSSRNALAKMVLVTAKPGTGKTSMVIHAIDYIRRVTSRKRQRVLIAKHVCRESDRMVPFSMLRSILPEILDGVQGWEDEMSVASTSKTSVISGMTWSTGNDSEADIQWENVSVGSAASLGQASRASPDRLLRLFREMEAPPEFVELVAHHLFGIEMPGIQEMSERKAPSLQRTVNFMVQAFQRCTQRANLVIIALDDVHNMDEMSWKVLHRLFVTTSNLLMICTSKPLTSYGLAIDDVFWNDLNETYKRQKRFISMNLSTLRESDIRRFLARELGVKEEEISERFYHYVFTQTGGQPQFAQDILQDLKRRRIVGMGEDRMFGWKNDSFSKDDLVAASIGELIVHRVDSFDQVIRNVLNLGAVLGDSFELLELITVLQQMDTPTSSQEIPHVEDVCASLDVLVGEGILRQIFEGGEESYSSEEEVSKVPPSILNTSETRRVNGTKGPFFIEQGDNRLYTFCHDLWRSSILQLMLDARKKEIHETIAITLEAHRVDDYESRVKLMNHWKASGNFSKTAAVSLVLGKSFEELGIYHQCIQLYEDTLNMWNDEKESDEMIGGLNVESIDSMSVLDLEYSIRLYTAMARCLASIHRVADSMVAFKSALDIFHAAPANDALNDRSVVFPIYSGICLGLKKCRRNEEHETAYEEELVGQFVEETRSHGDKIHYARAVAMKADMYGRQMDFKSAFEAFDELKEVYNVDQHSRAICEAYGSDRCAQCFSACALWHLQQNNVAEAVRSCRYVIDELMPKMPPRNVHNSCVMLYPIVWVFKENDLASEARDVFVKHVIEPFNNYYGEGAFTFYLPVYEPVLMLLNLIERQDAELPKIKDYLEFASNEDNLRFGNVINNSTGILGRSCDSIAAEICLLLAKRFEKGEEKEMLLRNGISVAAESVESTDATTMAVSLRQTKRVLRELESMRNKVET